MAVHQDSDWHGEGGGGMWNIKFLYNYVHFHELFLLFLLPHNHTGLAAKEKRALKHCLGMWEALKSSHLFMLIFFFMY